MASILRHGRIETANWPQLDEAGLRQLAARTGEARPELGGPLDGAIVPFQLWRAERSLCDALGIDVGVLVREDDDLAEVAA